MKRSTPLTRKSPLKRAGPVKRVNKKRREAEFERAFGGKASWVRTLPCAVCILRYARGERAGLHPATRVEVAHVRSRGAGGTSADVIPLCSKHHRHQHDMGIETFARKYGFDPHDLARTLESLWQQMQIGIQGGTAA